jgi:hypothetical protein
MTIPTVPAGGPDETPPTGVPLRDGLRAAPVGPTAFRGTLRAVEARPEELRWATSPGRPTSGGRAAWRTPPGSPSSCGR